MLCDWEVNCRSGVALAMRHGLSGLSTYRLNSHRKGDEHPTYALERHGMLYLYLISRAHTFRAVQFHFFLGYS